MPIPHHPGFGFAPIGAVFTDVIAALFFLICFVIVVGVLVVLVRFLLVATRAAELYVTRNGGTLPKWYWGAGDRAAGPSTSSGTATSTVAGPSTSSGTGADAGTGTARTRTPRTPKPSA